MKAAKLAIIVLDLYPSGFLIVGVLIVMNPEILVNKLFLKISESIQLLPLDKHLCRDETPARIIFVIDLHHIVHIVDNF